MVRVLLARLPMAEPLKILLAYDGSPRAESALRDLPLAGLPTAAVVKLLSVVEPWLPAGLPDLTCGAPLVAAQQGEWRHAAGAVRQGLAALQQSFPGWSCQTAVRRGNPVVQVIAEAQAWKPGLVIISPLNRSRFERALLGSFSRNVIEAAPCSVRVARMHQPNPATGLRLLVGFDGSRAAAAAVHEVARRGWPPHTEVRLVMINASAHQATFRPPFLETRWQAKELAHAAAVLTESGLRVTPIQRVGEPRQALLEEAIQWDAHCIFLGGTPRRGLSRWLAGRTGAAVAAQAACSVEIVHETFPRLKPIRQAFHPAPAWWAELSTSKLAASHG